MSHPTLVRAAVLVGYGAVGAVVGGVLAASIIVTGAAVFWIFIFGDDVWPGWAETALVGAAYAVALLVFLAAVHLGWRRTARR